MHTFTKPDAESDPTVRRSAHGPSFLRWAGSKRKSLALLSATYSGLDRHYVEPFAGSAALFFSLKPLSGTLADLNGHLINAMRYVRDQPKELHRRLEQMPRDDDTYYSVRLRFNRMQPYGLNSAALFVYLNRNCFNGLWRTNSQGAFNVPYGGTEMGGNPPSDLFQTCSRACLQLRRMIAEAS
jgi:DNA adenine methylase